MNDITMAAAASADRWPNLDAVMVDVEIANGLPPALVRKFEQRGLVVLRVIGDDGWFFDPNEEASVYRSSPAGWPGPPGRRVARKRGPGQARRGQRPSVP